MGILNRKDMKSTREFQNQLLTYLDKIDLNRITQKQRESIDKLRLSIRGMDVLNSKSANAVQASLANNVKGLVADINLDNWFFDDYCKAIQKNINERVEVVIDRNVPTSEGSIRNLISKIQRKLYNAEFAEDEKIEKELQKLIFIISKTRFNGNIDILISDLETSLRGFSKAEVLDKIDKIGISIEFPETNVQPVKANKEASAQIEILKRLINNYRDQSSAYQKKVQTYGDMLKEAKQKLADRNVSANVVLGKKILKDIAEYQTQQKICVNSASVFQNAAQGISVSLENISFLYERYKNNPEKSKALTKLLIQFIKSEKAEPSELQMFFEKLQSMVEKESITPIVSEVKSLDATGLKLSQEEGYTAEELEVLNSITEEVALAQAADATFENMDKISNS